MWWADPNVRRIVRRTYWRDLHRAVGFYQRTKWLCLSMFLESDLTVKEMQMRLGLRRPHCVYDLFFKYRKNEARTGAFMDAFERGMDVDIHIRADRFSDIEKNIGGKLPEKLFDLSQPLTEEEIEYLFSDKKLYWPRGK